MSKINYKYLDIPTSRESIMASREDQAAALLRLYSDHKMVDGESVLWNWIEAVAQANGITHEESRSILADAGDPITGNNAEVVGRWIFFLA